MKFGRNHLINLIAGRNKMLKSLIIYFGAYSIFGMFIYFTLSDSLLKSQQIHCNNGSQIACNYLKNTNNF